jgi:hypothetical protein
MLTKEEKKALNLSFWNKFQKKMRPIRSSNGRKMNWTNYPSDTKFIYIRLEVGKKMTRLCFDIQPKDQSVRAIIYEQCLELKKVLENEMKYPTLWIDSMETEDNRVISRICWEIDTFNFYREEDHEGIINFLSARLQEFDVFYQEYKEILIALIN